jgi:hypothetical protein
LSFFEDYQWHLDDRPLRSDKEINPDVLGYIFEKYINAIQPGEQKAKGAYYSKEDITEHISKNTVLPFLFEAAHPKCKIAFENPSGPTIWDLLTANPDNYIHPAVRHGISWDMYANNGKGALLDSPRLIPIDVASGVNDVSNRQQWNKLAPSEFALPTEIWREVVARRQHYHEIQTKVAAGEVRDATELVTLNLDIRQFAQDVIKNCEGPELLRAFWQAIENVAILDPACGSGAFLFAALNILEPLYEACLDRMQAFIDELDRSTEKDRPEKFLDFRKVLQPHPNRRYFVFKTIILNNLFGVDIMEEATEICKLRLFLKLAAQIQPDPAKENFGIEPLPDIDFNIRAGNSLVGYATYDDVKKAVTTQLDFENAMAAIHEKALLLQTAFETFRRQQTELGGTVTAEDKTNLQQRLNELETELNRYLASEYGKDFRKKAEYADWLASHKPFHWFVEFYNIMHRGGFDAIIGNPPYVEYSKIESQYRVLNARTLSTNNLFALFSERSRHLLNSEGHIGLIVPNSSVSAEKMKPLQTMFRAGATCWISNFSWRPSKLFDGANMLLAIWLVHPSRSEICYSTRYHRWYSDFRSVLFPNLKYFDVSGLVADFRIPKIPGAQAITILAKCRRVANGRSLLLAAGRGPYRLYYFRAVLYWFKVLTEPPVLEEDGIPTATGEMKELAFTNRVERDAALAIMASNLFALHYVIWSSCQVVNSPDLMFPVSLADLCRESGNSLSRLATQLMRDVQDRSEIQTRNYSARGRTYTMRKQYFFFKESKPIIDEIDQVLARHYGLTRKETDFIINYDIKYRMGLGGETA